MKLIAYSTTMPFVFSLVFMFLMLSTVAGDKCGKTNLYSYICKNMKMIVATNLHKDEPKDTMSSANIARV